MKFLVYFLGSEKDKIFLFRISFYGVASFALYVLVFKLNYLLTFPALILGICFFVCASFVSPSQRFLKIVISNVGLLSLMIGVLASVFNLIAFGVSLRESKDNKVQILYQGGYSKGGLWLTGNQAGILGYRYPPNVSNLRSAKFARKGSTERLIYDVKYNIDNLGNRRVSPSATVSSDSVLFVGGSFTFGEGLEDDQTLPAFFQHYSGLNAINAGMHGYGAHQALALISDPQVYQERTKGHNIKAVVYRTLLGHVKRTAGYSPWDAEGPCYLKQSGEISYQGSFRKCGKRPNSFAQRAFAKFSGSPELITSKLFQSLKSEAPYYQAPKKKDIDLFIDVVEKMHTISVRRGAEFIVLIEDLHTNPAVCHRDSGILERIIAELQKAGIRLIKTSEVYSVDSCREGIYQIEGDGHPSLVANQALAQSLTSLLSQHSDQ